MQLSRRARLVAGLVAGLSVIAYLVIVDLGLFAGRVHRGVTVEGHDVGGLTFPELVDELETRRDELLEREIVFGANGFSDSVTAADLRWNPQPYDTAQTTFAVGRSGLFDSASDRVRGWLGAVDVQWDGSLRPKVVGRLIARWEDRGGVDVDEREARALIQRAVASLGPTTYQIPLED
jgi:hypothetical protein